MSAACSWRSRPALAVAALMLAGLGALLPGRAFAADIAPAACPPAAAPIDAERFRSDLRDATQDHGFLWRIERGGRRSWLYGTIHLARPEWMFPGTRAKAAIAASDTIALELDLLDPAIPARLAETARTRPSDNLPAELASRLELRMVAECMDPALWRAFAPEFQIAVLSAMAARRSGLDPAYAIDGVLAVMGRILAKPVVSLETPESQIAALRAPTRAAMIDLVRDGLADLEAGRAGPVIERLADIWRDSDLATLEDYAVWCECQRDEAERQTFKVLLDDRNVLLAASIDAVHAAGQAVFAAVGSLHMIGPKGLPALMRERGFAVELVVPAR